MTIVVGIDPGLTGGLAILDSNGFASVFDLPVCQDGKRKWIDAQRVVADLLPPAHAHVYLEGVHAMPKQGVSSAFNFGMVQGSIIAAIQCAKLPLLFVDPAHWKREMRLSKDKNASLHKARLLYPNIDLTKQKHEGRAEALLIAHWAYQKYHRVPT